MKNLILLTLALSALETTAKPFRNSARSAHRASVERALLEVGPDGKGPGGALCVGPGGKVADVPGATPRRQEIKSDVESIEGAGKVQKIKMRYGPYSVPNMMKKSVTNEGGALWNCGDAEIEKPCEECTLLGLVAGLEYPNGTNANIDTGMWMHHMVAFTVGPGRWDPTCIDQPTSLPHFAVGTSPSQSERSFSSGNERTPLNMVSKKDANGGNKAGYHLNKEDNYRFIVDLMNMNMDDRTVYLTITYDLVDGPLPKGWSNLKPVWFDVDQCGMSEVPAAKQEGKYTLTAKPWTPNFEGEVVGMGSHLHDGGVNINVLINDKSICDSQAKYGENSQYIFKDSKNTMPGGEKVAEKHISSMSTCYYEGADAKKLDPSQSWGMTGDYDYQKFEGNLEGDGEQSGVMAIAIMFVKVAPGNVPMPAVKPAPAAAAPAAAAPAAAAPAKSP
ncbi:hypothetical protein BLS_009066 [Venturia inaequalis]|uniref:Diphthamide biosynthesis protein 2 n=1 Tax=Venturia inaequalis TaxID=5025 RepID=A0A8H3V2U7_VENIN|nr:hypothetical protein BLS_009066 [Venturia inaequalis]